MATKQIELIDLYQRLQLVVNTWIDLIPFQNFEFSSESSTFAYTINSNEFILVTRRTSGLPSIMLSITSDKWGIRRFTICCRILFLS